MFHTKRCRAGLTSHAKALSTMIALAMICPLAALRVATPALLRSGPVPSAIVHPNFSGKWRSDTAWVPSQEFEFMVTDSETIKQTGDAISIEGRGHIMTAQTHNLLPTHNLIQSIKFDRAASNGVTVTGTAATNVAAKAVWEGDTLVITTRAQAEGHTLQTTERMTLSPDGQILSDRNASLVDGKDRWQGGAKTFVLRRIAH
jgi:hypothetical protein